MTPRATVRLQFNRDFTLRDAVDVVPYFEALGISHFYASPLLTARLGSTHGYDVTDPTAINPELGGYPAMLDLARTLKRHGMGMILDIVPNHMAATAENPWWWDVLLWGRASRYAAFFDIDWRDADPELRGKVLLPVLGDTVEACLARGELKLDVDQERGLFVCRYFESVFPIDPRSVADVLEADGGHWDGLPKAARALRDLPPGDALESAAHRFCADLADRLRVARPGERQRLLARFNEGEGREKLARLLAEQNYRLAPWQEAPHRINWRRFFDIDQLVALRMDRPEVFDAYHAFTLDLIRDGLIDGVRVDHVDGLADPPGYCARLRQAIDAAAAPGKPYFVIEKILEKDEGLEPTWPVDGTTGYDFMDEVGAVLHDPEGRAPLTALWQELSGDRRDFHAVTRAARQEILERLFPKQLDRLAALFAAGIGVAAPTVRAGLAALLCAIHRYRLYGDAQGFSEDARTALREAEVDARRQLSDDQRPVLDAVIQALAAPAATELRARFGQLSATLTAKAVEDTAFYRYPRLLSRNKVGSDPERFAITPDLFHVFCKRRRDAFPQAMLATATHDHKRGEDHRARLAVLSEVPQEWIALVRPIAGLAPDVDAAVWLMVCQTVVGAWPLDLRADDREGLQHFQERLQQWLTKALREAKQDTSWAAPNEPYERRCLDFMEHLLDPNGEAFSQLARFVERVAPSGALKGLAQALLRVTAPGVPDLYRGTEFWDFSLVDPDNRAPVDFGARRKALEGYQDLETLLPDWRSGRIKQALIARLLRFRRAKPALFAQGSYEPVAASGKAGRQVVGFLRRQGEDALLAVATRFSAAAIGSGDPPRVPPDCWRESALQLPDDLRKWRGKDLLCDRTLDGVEAGELARLFDALSVAAVHLSPG